MFCPSCGHEIPENAAVCSVCGVNIPSPGQPAAGKKKPIIIAAAAVVMVAVIAFVVIILSLPNGSQAFVNEFVETVFEGDGDAVLDMAPEELIAYLEDEKGADRDKMAELIEWAIDDLDEETESMEYEIREIEDVNKRDMRKITEACEDDLAIDVSDCKTATVKVTLVLDDEKYKFNADIVIIKSEGKWYVYSAKLTQKHGEKREYDIIERLAECSAEGRDYLF